MKRMALALAATALVALGGCQWWKGWSTDGPQGWGEETREAWYRATQGSRLMPEAWFLALETEQGQPFASRASLAPYGFITRGGDALPIGFTRDVQDDSAFRVTKLRWKAGQGSEEPWVGLNCAACHTGMVSYGGRNLVIDGAPAMLDFQSFVEGLDTALKATRADAAKWDRFAKAVLGSEDTPENRALLEASYDSLLDWQHRTDVMNETPVRYGHGRLDAVGHILNKILMFNGANPSFGNPSDAPVSYPFIWNIWKQHRVQWDGVALNSRVRLPGGNFEYGALGRNTGEVIGVFGEVMVEPLTGPFGSWKGYDSSVRIQNLDSLEAVLRDLQSPAWPEEFPSIDKALAEKGDALFDVHCASCHKDPDSGTENLEVMAFFKDTPEREMTDIWMACNAYLYKGPTGPMKGLEKNGTVLGDEAPVATMLALAVQGALLGDKPALVDTVATAFLGVQRLPQVDEAMQIGETERDLARRNCLAGVDNFEDDEGNILGYKARPLDGIWATAPYLHNGSVKSLYELLLPAEERAKGFWVGNREFDPVNVGFEDARPADGNAFFLRVRNEDGSRIEVDSNEGHEYGAAGFSEEERRALVEYMKTL